MTPEAFIAKWRGATRTERSAAQEHFLDLCDLLDVKKPQEEDPHGEFYTFEKSVLKLDGRPGRADVWRKDRFAWEYKGPHKNLVKAYAQLKEYADALENPPLLIVSDMEEIRIHTNFTSAVSVQHTFHLPELMSVEARRTLRWCFTDPDRLKPSVTREAVTRDAAKKFGALAGQLRSQKHDPQKVAHFLNRLVFCLFVEDIDLLPGRVFADILEESAKSPDGFQPMLRELFRSMKDKGGRFGTVSIPWFNGGLFDDDEVLPLGYVEIRDLHDASRLDWSAIEPSIFGTLFEAGLDPEKREVMASLFDPAAKPGKSRKTVANPADKGVGIHYTDPATIMKIIEPVVVAPLRREWQAAKAEIATHRAARDRAKSDAARTRAENAARETWAAFRARLGAFRVLDPASGSGNFLYLSLIHLKDFDLEVLKEGQALGLPLDDQRVTPQAVKGIEINPYAAELARVTIWIGELQWQMRNAFDYLVKRAPILGRLDQIECRDALLTPEGKEAAWPEADVVVGNPPFLGGKRLRAALKDDYVERLFAAYEGRVPAEADLVAYWFAKGWELIKENSLTAAGLVSTNSIRGGANRRVLDPIAAEGGIFEAWDDEPWVVDGAAVRVSLLCFAGLQQGIQARLDGRVVERINADLTGGLNNLTTARRLAENAGVAFMGDTKGGAFDVPGEIARRWLLLPLNPNGRPNADVLRPWVNGMDISRRAADKWIVDFGWTMDETTASFYEAPFTYIQTAVKPVRLKNNREAYRRLWWRHVEPRPGMWRALTSAYRFIVTPEVSKHRIFAWLKPPTVPDHKLQVIVRSDDVCFGILCSRFHNAWALAVGSWHGVGNDPRYTITTCFDTFPFPEGMTPNIPATAYASDPRAQAIAAAAKRLDELRRNWLNPPDLIKIVPEVVPGFPDRILPVGPKAEAELKMRTLTNLYNQRPAWLDNAHRDLDAAVAAAYGWPADIGEEDALARLLALNHARAETQAGVPEAPVEDGEAEPLDAVG
ncbi:class I SAM-dependent DNA methyltransferase [Shumkonia mesophila]|uniref:class I SAM-dependent DNA methyltransferase n=1 Tax=Shumkonia mesophila TaxID=2838854 RepID=UPI0029342D34|nr:class I SAM-dependent DNA methyltransferase [Shumkonia mesophila]